MSVLVDEAEWPWRGDRWAHLVSDTSAAELHAFANRLGIRRLAFQDDHYDVTAAVRDAAIELGARPVTSRFLVEALHESGLRVRRREPWNNVSLDDSAVIRVLEWLNDVWPATRAINWTTVLRRRQSVGLSAVFHAVDQGHPVTLPPVLTGAAFTVAHPEGVLLDVVLAVPLPA